MTTVVVTHPAADGAFERALLERDDSVVRERAVGDGVFESDEGPFLAYERRVTAQPDGGVEERISFRLAAPGWWPLFVPLYRMALARPERFAQGDRPWWWFAPPDRFDARSSTVLALLCGVGLAAGYLGTLISQTLTFAGDEFGVSTSGQATVLAAVRAGVLVTIVLALLADRAGRRRLLIGTAVAGCIVTATGALAPNIWALGASQTVARGLATTLQLLLAIVAAEEVPRGNRAYAASLLFMSQALGSGMTLWLLPLADLGETSWRLLYVAPLLFLPLVALIARRLPESRRFDAPHGEATMAGHGRRFWMLAAAGFLLAVFAAPGGQLLNEFLRDERGFSAWRVSLFTMLTVTPGGIAIIAGGWLADRRGRRVVAATGIVLGTLLAVARFGSTGWAMWVLGICASLGAALVVPALRVYPAELFPTSLRGGAGGTLEALSIIGSVIGLLGVGFLVDDGWSYAAAFGVVAVAPLLVAVLVLTVFPETARRELEDLNPEDRVPDRPG